MRERNYDAKSHGARTHAKSYDREVERQKLRLNEQILEKELQKFDLKVHT
jgi:hypothetical protein